MWKPKQLLNDEVVLTLLEAGFSDNQIQFLGWLNGMASALNNSTNPAKAAHTMLTREKVVKQAEKFLQKKKESVAPPKPPDTEQCDKIFRELGKLDDRAAQNVAESTPRQKAAHAGEDE
jgi:hypothetical protein